MREEALEPPGTGEVLLESIVIAVSPGTEMLFHRGEIEEGAAVDTASIRPSKASSPLRSYRTPRRRPP